jgi:hypothetical protein
MAKITLLDRRNALNRPPYRYAQTMPFRMKLRVRAAFVLAIVLALSAVVFRQAREIHRLRDATAEQREEETAVAPAVTPVSEEVEKLRREAAEVHSLRAEVSNLRTSRRLSLNL